MVSTLFFSVGIFAVMAVFFGFISFQVLVKKKPVVIASRWLLILISLSLLPAIVLNLLNYRADSEAGLFQLLTPVLFVFLIESLGALGVKYTERMNKLVLDDLGTGMVRSKDTKNITAYFYIGFALFMLAASVCLAWLSTVVPVQ